MTSSIHAPRHHVAALLLFVASAVLAGCVSPPPASGRPQVAALGRHIPTSHGNLFLVRVQDEYRLIRCIPSGPIAGCYEDVLSVADRDVRWNHWMEVAAIPGLRVSLVSPTDVAFDERPLGAPVPPVPSDVMAR